jgi:hypothetical protein
MAEKRKVITVVLPKKNKYDQARYAIADPETGEILDDAQGYGYKSRKKAYAGWSYTNRDKSKDPHFKKIKRWFKSKQNEELLEAIEEALIYAYEEGQKFTADDLYIIIQNQGIMTTYTAKDLYRVWKNL